MTARDKLGFALGMAQKAGKLASGDMAVRFSVKSGKAVLLLLAADISDNARKCFANLAVNVGLPVMTSGLDKHELGRAVGKGQRTAVAVLDKGFTKMIMESIRL
ncbi:MAG: ribosomal L7Ae/L30e/S12e/Gadd45 family protein [Acidaminococcales bacterium]|jgi:ribosomal protein L7Ae-like RNA K-turn-binding protein|nr:ribosomal L7Ae/L30e/S12e/Gadd45 family protein [Acidaminococcales bacterium]